MAMNEERKAVMAYYGVKPSPFWKRWLYRLWRFTHGTIS